VSLDENRSPPPSSSHDSDAIGAVSYAMALLQDDVAPGHQDFG
jgi:hypothetical protein